MPTTDVFYVNTASSPGGDGTTNDTSGTNPNRAYASLQEFSQQRATNLVTADKIYEVNCAGLAADTTQTSFANSTWTTDATRYIHIKGNRSDPTGFYSGNLDFSESHYRLSTSANFKVLRCNGVNVRIDGIQMRQEGNSNLRNILEGTFQSGAIIEKCRFRMDGDTTNQTCIYPFVGSVTTNISIVNNIFSGTNPASAFLNAIWFNAGSFGSHTINIYNNTVNAMRIGFRFPGSADASGMVWNVKNNALFRNGNDWVGTAETTATWNKDYNAADDNDVGTNWQDLNDNASGEWDNSFTDWNQTQNNRDLTVKDTSSLLYDNGIGNGGDSNVPTDDIRDIARVTDEIGAFAFTVPGISPSSGTLSLAGQSASLTLNVRISPAQGALSLAGQLATLAASIVVSPAAGTLALAGQTPTVGVASIVSPLLYAISFAGAQASAAIDVKKAVTAGALSWAGQQAESEVTEALSPTAGTVSLAGQLATLTLNVKIAPTAGAYTLAGQAVVVASGHLEDPSAGALALAGQSATAALHVRIAPTAGVATLAGQPVAVTGGVFVGARPGGIGKRRRKRVMIDGQLFTVNTPMEESLLLQEFLERRREEAKRTVDSEKKREVRTRIKRLENRLKKVESESERFMRMLRDEDEEILVLFAGL